MSEQLDSDLAAANEQIDRLLRALKCAMKISDLWLPGPDCDPEEATALQMMAAMFEEAIHKATERE